MHIDRYKALAALIRAFFTSFSSGITDSRGLVSKESRTAQAVKKAMLEHYEDIAPAFHDTLFYPIAAMNFSYEDVAAVVAEAHRKGDDMAALLRAVCATKPFYDAMVAEYRRNFSCLLAGRNASMSEHLASYTRPTDAEGGTIDTDRAIQLVTRVVMFAYSRGLAAGCPDGESPSMRHPTLFSLLLDTMNVLLHDQEIVPCDDGSEELASLFVKVCGSQHNFGVMTDEMDRTYEEIART